MAVIVDYKEEWGYCTYIRRKKEAEGLKTFLHPANCLFAEIHHWKDEKGEKWSTLMGFYIDERHMERCLKSFPFKDKIYHLNTYYPLWKKVGKLLSKYGWQVKLYYKEPKN